VTDRPEHLSRDQGIRETPQGTAPDSTILELEERLAVLEHRLETSQRETVAIRERAVRERLRFETELDRHRRLLEDRSRRLERIRHDLERIRGYRLVRLALGLRAWARGPLSIARRRWWWFTASATSARERLLGGGPAGRRRTMASSTDERKLISALRADLRGSPAPTTDLVTIVISVRHGGPVLSRLLGRLLETDWPRAAVVLLGGDAASTASGEPPVEQAIDVLAARPDWTVTRQSGDPARLGPAHGSAVEAWSGEFVVFLHDDVEPFDRSWLARLVEAQRDRNAGAVGARMVHPRRPLARNTHPDEPADLTLEHGGIDFVIVDGMPRPRMIGSGTDPLAPSAKERSTRPAVSDACLLVPRDVLDVFAGTPGDDPASKAVEFCLTLWAHGRPVVYEGMSILWHHDPQSEKRPPDALEDPWQGVVDRWGPRLFREVFRDRIAGERRWSVDPLHIAITLTREDRAAPYGDWYTAHELGDALAAIGWRVSYIERHKDHWYDLDASVDVVVALLDLFDLTRIPRHVVTVAWIRNWTDRWLSHSWFNDYDIVLASSQRSKEMVDATSSKVAHLMPLATNPARFRPLAEDSALASDAAFVGSDWGEERGVATALPALAATGCRVRVWGRNWESDARMAPLAAGVLDYERVPAAYASAKIVVDDTASPTKPYGAVNSRVFDALAAGTIVVTDNGLGARELFDQDFPTWDSPETLVRQVETLLADDARREELVRRYRQIVLERHTYTRRAEELRTRLLDWTHASRVALHIGPQTWEHAPRWGDTHFGRDVQRQFERRGHPAVLLVFEERARAIATRCDIAIHIFGVRAPETRPCQIRLLWIISHPDRVTSELCAGYDAIFVASDLFLDHLRLRTQVPLIALHQATDPDRFHPDPTGPAHELLFVGNSRGVRRPIIDDLAGTSFDLAVYGGDWTPGLLDPKYFRGEWISNDELARYYSSASIVLNDHWQDMRDEGFISNRIYDALASGAFVVSDDVPGLDEEFDRGVVTYRRRDELIATIDRYLVDPDGRREVAERGRNAVLARHTFGHRVDTILGATTDLVARHPTAIADGPSPSRLD
jgi:spore maturation protein CgeB